MARCERAGEKRGLRWEVASPMVAAVGPSPLSFPLQPSCMCLLVVCFSSGSVRDREQ